MKKLIGTLLLVSLLWLGGGQAVLATHDDSEPLAECAVPFELHHAMNHDNHHGGVHRHIGSDTDKNGDGYLYVKHISHYKHLHIDNSEEEL